MDKLARFVAETAETILASGEQVMNLAFSLYDQDDETPRLVAIPVFPFETQIEKRKAFTLALGIARTLGGQRLLMLSDAWMATVDPDEVGPDGDLGLLPSQRPDRTEALVLADCTELGVIGYMLPYTRDEDNKPVFGDWEEYPHSSLDGMMVDILIAVRDNPPPAKAQEEIRAFAERLGWDAAERPRLG